MPHLRKFIGAALSALVIVTGLPGTSFAGLDALTARAEAGVPGNSSARLKREIDAILAREFLPVSNAGIKVICLQGDAHKNISFYGRIL